jgi:hypothetical protein
VVWFSAYGEQYLGALLAPLAYLRARYVEQAPSPALLGIPTMVLVVAGAWRGASRQRGGRRASLLHLGLAVTLAVLSLGPRPRMRFLAVSVPGPYALLSWLPGFDALRVPARAYIAATVSVAVLAGLAADGLLGRARSRAARAAAVALLGAVAVAECWHQGWRTEPVRDAAAIAPVYRWLARQPGEIAIVELPLGNAAHDTAWMVGSRQHWKRLVNGYSGFRPAVPYLFDVLARFPDPPSLRLLGDLRVRFAVIHDDLMQTPRCRALTASPARTSPCIGGRRGMRRRDIGRAAASPGPRPARGPARRAPHRLRGGGPP